MTTSTLQRVIDGVEYGAEMSPEDSPLYRYKLWRTWDAEKPSLVYVMLNPSTADHTQDDQTIRRCMHFARRDGYGGIIVVNLFSGRATDPDDLFAMADPIGPMGNWFLSQTVMDAARNEGRVIVAWGAHPKAAKRREQVLRAIQSVTQPYCFGINQNGSPKHPCYLGNNHPVQPLAA